MDVFHLISDVNNMTSDIYEYLLQSNITSNSNGNEKFYREILWWKILWTILFSTTVVVATTGNFALMLTILLNKKVRTVTNYFLVNLSIADTMVATLNVALNMGSIVFMEMDIVPCQFAEFISVLSISVSVFTFVAISIDRYIAIMSPFRPHLGLRTTSGIIAVIWTLSSVIGSPNLIYLRAIYYFDDNPRSVCYNDWPNSKDECLYNFSFFILIYALPMILMSYTYTRVCIRLWGSQSIGETNQTHQNSDKIKRRVVKMVIIVVIVFAVCWLPFFLLFVYNSCYNRNIPFNMYIGIYWLGTSNCMYNPLICFWMNPKFRSGFKELFCGCDVSSSGTFNQDHRDVELGPRY